MRQKELIALAKEQILKLGELLLGWIKLARVDDFVDLYDHILEAFDRLAVSLEMIAKDGGGKRS